MLASCTAPNGTKPPEDQVRLDLLMRYSVQSESLESEASLQLADSAQYYPYFLENPPLLNQQPMEKQFTNHKGVFYRLQQTGAPSNSYVFSFNDYEGKEKQVKIALPMPPELPISEMWRQQANTVEMTDVTGLQLLIADANNRLHVLVPQQASGTQYTILPPADIATGSGKAFWVKKSKQTFEESGIYIYLKTEATSPSMNIDIR